ncbi:uncharacterized protein LOC117909123 [Vitis riparia]|uniref:uncharacterized protein LOC117909123 n=1 Tax=Vitis riparia TaxID=96939 RepID=UPI00155A439A|nr:uncharacterized protein LOC117909123 [Vitis riparia]
MEKVCKTQPEEEIKAAAADQYHEEQLFVATCSANKNTSESWLIDSGCTNHMTYDQGLFRELDKTTVSKVRIGNGKYISARGKGTAAIESLSVFEPAGFNEAIEDKNLRVAMQEELSMIEKNNTWELVDRPTHKKVIGVKWVYKTKLNSDGSVNKHKAKLVVKARLDTIRMLLALIAQKGWKIYQLDVKSAFLNGYVEEEIFVEQPGGYAVKDKEDKVAKRIVRYIKGTIDFGIKFKQDIMAQSTAEAEHIAVVAAANQALWTRKLLIDLNMEQTGSTQVFVDNQAIFIQSHQV